MKCVICEKETGSKNDTCSGDHWLKALQFPSKKIKNRFIEIDEND